MLCSVNNFYPPFRASISDGDIDALRSAKQTFSDCYLMSTLDTLSHTENGRRILKDKIQYDDNNPNVINCSLYSPQNTEEKYSVPADTVVKGYEKLYDRQQNDIVRSMDISVAEYEKKHQSKPWLCKVTGKMKTYDFEHDMPSHFMKMLTGIEPRVIAESGYNLDLNGCREDVMKLFERMDKEKNHSFVIGTGVKMLDGRSWHVYVLEDVDLKNNTVTVKEKRKNKPQTMSIDTALNTFKYITGYFDEDLAQAE